MKAKAMTIEELRKLIGRKVEYSFARNGSIDPKSNEIMNIEALNIHEDTISVRTSVDYFDEDYIIMRDEEFSKFLDGEEYVESYTQDEGENEEHFKLTIIPFCTSKFSLRGIRQR